jgi:alkaline phosphatase
MIISQFEVKIYQKLEDFFSEEGFELLIDKKQFRKINHDSFQNVIFSISDGNGDVWIEVNFGVRNGQIEQFAQQFLNNRINFRADANTLVTNIGKFSGQKHFRFKIRNEFDLESVIAEIKDFFATKGFNFMENASNLHEIDRILNEDPAKPCLFLYNQIHRCFKGIIVAKLVNRKDFAELMDKYRDVLIFSASDEELLNFERMIGFLLHYNAN